MDETQVRGRMEKVLETVRQDISTIRTGRATPSLVEDIIISAYGGQQRLHVIELASITAPDTQSLLISPWDKSIIGDIKKGIELANLGFNPIITGENIRISFPPLTQEDRERYVKTVHQKLELGRVHLRQVRQDEMQGIKGSFEKKEISEDEMAQHEKRLQSITDEFVGKIEELGKAKENELRSL